MSHGGYVTDTEGIQYNIINTSAKEDMRLYTIYTPPEHKDGTVHKTKTDALAAGHWFG
jgi:mannose-6-phosphate isomerase-like protein (cupin superfamily)